MFEEVQRAHRSSSNRGRQSALKFPHLRHVHSNKLDTFGSRLMIKATYPQVCVVYTSAMKLFRVLTGGGMLCRAHSKLMHMTWLRGL